MRLATAGCATSATPPSKPFTISSHQSHLLSLYYTSSAALLSLLKTLHSLFVVFLYSDRDPGGENGPSVSFCPFATQARRVFAWSTSNIVFPKTSTDFHYTVCSENPMRLLLRKPPQNSIELLLHNDPPFADKPPSDLEDKHENIVGARLKDWSIAGKAFKNLDAIMDDIPIYTSRSLRLSWNDSEVSECDRGFGRTDPLDQLCAMPWILCANREICSAMMRRTWMSVPVHHHL